MLCHAGGIVFISEANYWLLCGCHWGWGLCLHCGKRNSVDEMGKQAMMVKLKWIYIFIPPHHCHMPRCRQPRWTRWWTSSCSWVACRGSSTSLASHWRGATSSTLNRCSNFYNLYVESICYVKDFEYVFLANISGQIRNILSRFPDVHQVYCVSWKFLSLSRKMLVKVPP